MTRSQFAEPINVRAAIVDAMRDEARMVEEYHSAFDRAQLALLAPAPLVDEHGTPFAEGQTVETFRELWRSSAKPGHGMTVHIVGTRGVLTQLGPTNAAIVFEGNPEPYWIRVKELARALHVVEAAK